MIKITHLPIFGRFLTLILSYSFTKRLPVERNEIFEIKRFDQKKGSKSEIKATERFLNMVPDSNREPPQFEFVFV